MTVNLGLRRIASLSAFLVAIGFASASQAGIIPWAYDAIFGPVRYPAYGYGYSPYVVSYSQPVYVQSSPRYYGYASGCSSCATSYYSPVSYSSPSYGCGSVVVAPSCGPCGGASYASTSGCRSGCSSSVSNPVPNPAPTTAPATNGKSAWKKPAEPTQDPVLVPRTFQNPDRGASPAGATSTDGLGSDTRLRGTPANEAVGNEVEVNRPSTAIEEPTIIKPKKAPTKSADDFDNLFDSQPKPPSTPPTEKKFEEPIEAPGSASEATGGNSDTSIRLPKPKLELDSKITWRSETFQSRVPFHAKFAKASVARRTPGVISDWTPVVAKSMGTQLVRK